MQRVFESFRYAIEGIGWTVREHPNLRIHVLVSVAAVSVAYLLRFDRLEFSLLILTIVLVIIAEMMNTAVEEVTDLITVKWAQQAKIAKDVAAGMVLISAVAAVLIGVLLFLPKFMLFK